MTVYFIGVDVGTGSVRAALVSETGEIARISIKDIKTWNIQPDFYEQSTEEIWGAVIICIKAISKGFDSNDIKGIGFDATCSLACFDKKGEPLSVSPTGNNQQNVILWLDHRAVKEADDINKFNHSVLQYVGGKISPEMETPKLLWLKRNLRAENWDKAGYFFDLPDFLTWKATDVDSRSSCSLVCKWTYEISDGECKEGWNKSYFQQIGLEDLAANNWKRIGSRVLPPGTPVGSGLSEKAAEQLGLRPGIPIGTSMIDAHAGGLGLIGCVAEGIDASFNTRLGLICGTSTCHMAVSEKALFVPGIWGPYKNAMVPGMWLNEGGQSATGKLIDHVLDNHPATAEIKAKIDDNRIIHEYLQEVLEELTIKKELTSMAFLTRDLHVWPDFHGNRSPIADPTLKGAITGLTLSRDEKNLAVLYLATIQALSYGTRHIIETLKTSGYNIKSLLICGGLSKNEIFMQTQADICGLPTVIPDEPESVLLGSALLGACAAKHFPNVTVAIQTMAGTGKVVEPINDPLLQEYHRSKYLVFLEMYNHQLLYREIMKGRTCNSLCSGHAN